MSDALKAMLGASLAAAVLGMKEDGNTNTGSPELLKKLGERYLVKNEMAPGDLVMWKKGLKITKYPEYGKPAVVLEIVPGRRLPMQDGKGVYVGELANMRIGIADDEGDLVGFWVNQNRFEHYHGEIASQENAPKETCCEETPA